MQFTELKEDPTRTCCTRGAPQKFPGLAPTGTTCEPVLSLFFAPSQRRFPFRSRALRSCGFRLQSVFLGMPRAIVVRARHSSLYRYRIKSTAICNVLLSLLERRKKARPRFPASTRQYPSILRRPETSIFLPRDTRAPRTGCRMYEQRVLILSEPSTIGSAWDDVWLQTFHNFLPDFILTLAFPL